MTLSRRINNSAPPFQGNREVHHVCGSDKFALKVSTETFSGKLIDLYFDILRKNGRENPNEWVGKRKRGVLPTFVTNVGS